jgi:hypothetical protein
MHEFRPKLLCLMMTGAGLSFAMVPSRCVLHRTCHATTSLCPAYAGYIPRLALTKRSTMPMSSRTLTGCAFAGPVKGGSLQPIQEQVSRQVASTARLPITSGSNMATHVYFVIDDSGSMMTYHVCPRKSKSPTHVGFPQVTSSAFLRLES